MKRTTVFFRMFWICVGAAAFLISKAEAAEVEMEVKVANGTTEETHYIEAPPGATMMQCIFLAQPTASRWVAENLGPNWIVVRLVCGPPRRQM